MGLIWGFGLVQLRGVLRGCMGGFSYVEMRSRRHLSKSLAEIKIRFCSLCKKCAPIHKYACW